MTSEREICILNITEGFIDRIIKDMKERHAIQEHYKPDYDRIIKQAKNEISPRLFDAIEYGIKYDHSYGGAQK